MTGRRVSLAALIVLTFASFAYAGDADIIDVHVKMRAAGLYDFDVTVRSKDAGWARYADWLEAVDPEGTMLGKRVLEHPHDDEQPFTRDLLGVHVPAGVKQVVIRAHFKPSGYGGSPMTVSLPDR